MKVLVVGAGPCGLYTSRLLVKQGHDVHVLEEHDTIGRPVQCAGLVSKELIDTFGPSSVLNTIDGAHVRCSSVSFDLVRPGVAKVIDRATFDASFSHGVDISCGQRVTNVEVTDDTYVVSTPDAAYSADIVIGADGPSSIVRRSLGFPSEIDFYAACQERVRIKGPFDESMVTVDLQRPFFSWAIPEGDGIARIGTVGSFSSLERFKHRFGFEGTTLERTGGTIPVGKCSLIRGNAFLVGDAAAQTKPLSGGGLSYGMRAAEFLAEAIDAGDPCRYYQLWNAEYGREMSFGRSIRKMYENMSEHDLVKVMSIIAEKRESLESEADFDNHASIARVLFSTPRFYTIIGKAFAALIG
jgi:geranylgeranyl reductase family protein